MEISFDEEKRRKTLSERSLDFRDAASVFAGDVLTRLAPRDYGEEIRFQTIGRLGSRAAFIA